MSLGNLVSNLEGMFFGAAKAMKSSTNRRGFLKKTLIGAGLLSGARTIYEMIMPDDAIADDIQMNYDSNGNVIGWTKTIDTGVVGSGDKTIIHYDANGNEVGHTRQVTTGPTSGRSSETPSYDLFKGLRQYDTKTLLNMGSMNLEQGNYREAERCYSLATDKGAGLDSVVGEIKSQYMAVNSEKGLSEAKRLSLGMLQSYQYSYHSNGYQVLEGLKKQIEQSGKELKEDAVMTFTVFAYENYMKGKQAYDEKRYKAAIQFLEKAVMPDKGGDPHNAKAWMRLQSSVYRFHNKNERKRDKIKELAKSYNPTHSYFK